jgi:hypothetical protein
MLTGALGRLLDVDIDHVFGSSREAQRDIESSIRRASKVRILTGRGHDLQLQTFTHLFAGRPTRGGANVQILLPTPTPQVSSIDWTALREAELEGFDPAFGQGLLRQQIEASASFLIGHARLGVEIRFFDAPHLGRLIITNHEAYLTLYAAKRHGRDSRIYMFRRGDLYDGLERYFDLLWAASKSASTNAPNLPSLHTSTVP